MVVQLFIGCFRSREEMEAVVEVIWIGLATIVFVYVATLLRRSTRHSPYAPILPSIEISDPAVARRMLFDHADAFSNRPNPFPLDFSGGSYSSISIMPHGPLWRALRCSLTVDILHPTRLSVQEPLQRDAVKILLAGLSSAAVSHGHVAAAADVVVVVRDSLRTAAYALMARLCFGDVTDDVVHGIDRAQREFFVALAGTKEVEGSCLPRFLYMRRWLRFDTAFNRLSELLIPLIAARRTTLQHGQRGCGGGFVPYVDSLLNLRVHDDNKERVGDDGGRMLTEKEMAPLVWEFLVAGVESVVSCVEWALAHLVSQPEVQNKLHREVERESSGFVTEEHLRSSPYLRAVVLECLRMHPTVPFIMREVDAHHAAAVGGGATKRSMVIINARDIGRDRGGRGTTPTCSGQNVSSPAARPKVLPRCQAPRRSR